MAVIKQNGKTMLITITLTEEVGGGGEVAGRSKNIVNHYKNHFKLRAERQ